MINKKNIRTVLALCSIIYGISISHQIKAAWYGISAKNPLEHAIRLHPDFIPFKVSPQNNTLFNPGSVKIASIILDIDSTNREMHKYEIENVTTGLENGNNNLGEILPGLLALENIIAQSPNKELKISPINKDMFLPTGIVSINEKNVTTGIRLDFIPESSIGEKKSILINLHALSQLILNTLSPTTTSNSRSFKAFRTLALINDHAIQVTLDFILTEKNFTLDSVRVDYFITSPNNATEHNVMISLTQTQLIKAKVITSTNPLSNKPQNELGSLQPIPEQNSATTKESTGPTLF